MADAVWALDIAAGLLGGGPSDAGLNVEAGNAVVDIADAMRIARKVAGVDVNP